MASVTDNKVLDEVEETVEISIEDKKTLEDILKAFKLLKNAGFDFRKSLTTTELEVTKAYMALIMNDLIK